MADDIDRNYIRIDRKINEIRRFASDVLNNSDFDIKNKKHLLHLQLEQAQDLSRFDVLGVREKEIAFLTQELEISEKSLHEPKVESIKGENVLYQDGILRFKTKDGKDIPVDFTNAPLIRNIFEVFWKRRIATGENSLKVNEAIAYYKKIFPDVEEIDRRLLSDRISKIRTTKINKNPFLRERFSFDYNKSLDTWIMNIK